ncbi:MAG: hypothetical protein K2X47_17115 [Bdellovibrionales bacterium]|nr:hypothetical protein [Bdellovibrionales bacterium]
MSTAELRVVYLQFTGTHQTAGLGKLKQMMAEFFPNAKRHFCVVDNSMSGSFEISVDSETDLIPGNNESRDFSGYDCGIRWLQKAYPPTKNTTWVFANDTFHRDLGPETLKFFKKNIIDFGLRTRSFVGYEDRYPQPVSIFGLPLQRWIRTHFFMLSDQALAGVLPLAVPFEDSDIFGTHPKHFFKQPSPLSENYQRYLMTWLFGRKDPKGEFSAVWRSAEALTSRNFHDFKAKTRAILSEHYLSARLLNNGLRIVPVNNGMLSVFIEKAGSVSKHQKWQNPKANLRDANLRRFLSS